MLHKLPQASLTAAAAAAGNQNCCWWWLLLLVALHLLHMHCTAQSTNGLVTLHELQSADNSLSGLRTKPALLNKALSYLLQRKRNNCCTCPNCVDAGSKLDGSDVGTYCAQFVFNSKLQVF